jgi:autotransporter passenger strand-loop-strand repeat protein
VSGGVDSGSVVNGDSTPDPNVLSGVVLLSGGNAYNDIIDQYGEITVQSGGKNYSGTITQGGAAIYVSSGGTNYDAVNDGGAIVISSGGVNSATTEYSGEIVLYSGGKDYDSNIGAFVYNSGGTTYDDTVDSGGHMFVYAGGTDSGVTLNSGGAIYVSSGGTEFGLTISGGQLWFFDGGLASGGITFAGEGGIIRDVLGETLIAAPISGFGVNDYIDFVDLAPFSTVSLAVSGDDVTVTSGGTTYSLDIVGASSLDLGLVYDGDGGVDLQELCYLRGTRILTPTGEVCVEDLKIGDAVMTRFNAMRPIKWIGRQSHEARGLDGRRDRFPVHIRPGALGPNLPARDLFVSPGHSMLVGETLVLASSLINGVTITQDWAPETIEYYQIEFETHDCVVAEGAWSESFADGPGLRAQFHNAAEYYALYPDDPSPECLRLCAARPERGAALDAALRPIVTRAAEGLAPGRLKGHIDRVAEDRAAGRIEIDGWALDEAHPELPVLLEVLAGDRVIGTVLACDHRVDLTKAGYGQGRCAFFFAAPDTLAPGEFGGLWVRRAADGKALSMTAACRARLPQPEMRQAA